MNGILNIFKPKGISSYQVVKEVRNILDISKAGHTGTLDPFASGVLLICIGQATKIAEFLVGMKKHYQGEMILGISTDSQDSEGKIIQKREVKTDINEKRIKDIFRKYEGTISQMPPMFSAAHYKGKRLYHLARKGIEVKRNPKKVKIYQLNLINFAQKVNPIVKFEVVCSKGTYVRTLCNDIGDELGCGAHLSNLVRKKVGNFSIEDSLNLEELKKEKALGKRYLISIDSALEELNKITLKNEAIKTVLNGGVITSEQIVEIPKWLKTRKDKFVKIFDTKGNLLSIGTSIKDDRKNIIFKPVKVFRNY
ncbi:MAG TPA: tRNA pseudouridine(55) synthase TruB [Candidatus Atribacteria bacterium]|nr:MAG: tRNA pseudouridine synthase B [Atribacteria bacterium 34_128]HAJ33978.1 tRNA pseudouridine(55) synthase TruB [Candidatus Atribacteria bacterium]